LYRYSEVVAFGDANNDVEMLAACGISYAMPNGREAALAAARRRCRFDNAGDGVAVELEALVADGAFTGAPPQGQGEENQREEEAGVGAPAAR
jgi:phosphoserine phosphatase